jgi:hypothetical protein
MSGTLTKARIAQALIETNGYAPQKASETIEIVLELIKRSLENGEDVLIREFVEQKILGPKKITTERQRPSHRKRHDDGFKKKDHVQVL